MTLNLPAGAITDAATISPLALFLQADIVVKGVMIGLLLASIWTWAMIIGFSVTLRSSRTLGFKGLTRAGTRKT